MWIKRSIHLFKNRTALTSQPLRFEYVVELLMAFRFSFRHPVLQSFCPQYPLWKGDILLLTPNNLQLALTELKIFFIFHKEQYGRNTILCALANTQRIEN